jgi:S-adenosylmethionine:tRNA ribosyltransferase-isomerase
MKLSDFDFDLPEDLIALRPATPRTAARMLVSQNNTILDHHFDDLCDFLRAGDRLVFNDTKVIPARLSGHRRRISDNGETLAAVELTLIEAAPNGEWLTLAKPARRLKVGETILFEAGLEAQVLDKSPEGVRVVFNAVDAELDAAIQAQGTMPLPPYIAAKRPADEKDLHDYQTVFAKNLGAVAAPTASLHFDQATISRLSEMGVEFSFVTLHVGAGTFLPVKVDDIKDHKMHSEWGNISKQAAQEIAATKEQGGRVIPVGTTALRLVESAACPTGNIEPWVGATDIFITPGFEFKVADGLMTNFHLPKSTLMMLVSALVGKRHIQDVYRHAVAQKYRFFSYGDTSLLLRKSQSD